MLEDISSPVFQKPILKEKGKIKWEDCDPANELGSKAIWAQNMKQLGTFADRIFIYLASEYLSREFVIIPIFEPQNGGNDRVCIKPIHTTAKYQPLYFLYYSDARFVSPHYQSIRPSDSNQDSSIPVVAPTRQTLRSIPEDLADLSEPIHSSSRQKRKSDFSTDIIESSQPKKSKVSREQSYLSQNNVILSPGIGDKGVIPMKCFRKVFDLKKKNYLYQKPLL